MVSILISLNGLQQLFTHLCVRLCLQCCMHVFICYLHAILRCHKSFTTYFSELGIKDDFKIIEFNPFSAKEEEMDWYKNEVNPHGLVPSMVLPDGTHMVESAAICMYIADKYGKMLPEPDKEPVYYRYRFYHKRNLTRNVLFNNKGET